LLRLHPDKSKDDPETAQRKFMEMQEAFEALSDPSTKSMIDDVVRIRNKPNVIESF
jgi:curved DNA-binding protein CbpA